MGELQRIGRVVSKEAEEGDEARSDRPPFLNLTQPDALGGQPTWETLPEDSVPFPKTVDSNSIAWVLLNATNSDRDRKWAIEKLVCADCDYGWAPMESQKYALQPRKVFATGVHNW